MKTTIKNKGLISLEKGENERFGHEKEGGRKQGRKEGRKEGNQSSQVAFLDIRTLSIVLGLFNFNYMYMK